MVEGEGEESFIRLVALIRDDPMFRKFFTDLQESSDLEKNLKLTKIIEDMKVKNANQHLIDAVILLRRKELFEQIIHLIK